MRNGARVPVAGLCALALTTIALVSVAPASRAEGVCDPIRFVCVGDGGAVCANPTGSARCTLVAVGWSSACTTTGAGVAAVAIGRAGQCGWTFSNYGGPRPLVAVSGEHACGAWVSVSMGLATCRGSNEIAWVGLCLTDSSPDWYAGGHCGVGVFA